jgi:hypothetical protein
MISFLQLDHAIKSMERPKQRLGVGAQVNPDTHKNRKCFSIHRKRRRPPFPYPPKQKRAALLDHLIRLIIELLPCVGDDLAHDQQLLDAAKLLRVAAQRELEVVDLDLVAARLRCHPCRVVAHVYDVLRHDVVQGRDGFGEGVWGVAKGVEEGADYRRAGC